jgi:hypothetical protein
VNEVIRVAAELRDVCDDHRWRYCFIGGPAVLRWGEPRETVDVDVTLLTGFADEMAYVAALMARFAPRRSDAAEFARIHRVLLLEARSGVGLDIALGGLPFEDRSSTVPAPSRFLPMSRCAPARLKT